MIELPIKEESTYEVRARGGGAYSVSGVCYMIVYFDHSEEFGI
jgi:hypothetical protein